MVTGRREFFCKIVVRKLHERGAIVFVVDTDHYDLRQFSNIRRALSDNRPQTVLTSVSHNRWVEVNNAQLKSLDREYGQVPASSPIINRFASWQHLSNPAQPKRLADDDCAGERIGSFRLRFIF